MFMAESEEISYVQSWISIFQKSSESIRRSGITSQDIVPNLTWGGGQGAGRNDV